MDEILTRGFIESPVFHKKWFDLEENLSQEERNNIRARIPKFEKELFERIKYE